MQLAQHAHAESKLVIPALKESLLAGAGSLMRTVVILLRQISTFTPTLHQQDTTNLLSLLLSRTRSLENMS